MSALSGSLGRAIGVRAGEAGRLVGVAALFALLEAGRGFGEIGVDTVILRAFGPAGLPSVLPFLYMGLGAVGLVVALLYTAALGRMARVPLFVTLLGSGAVLIIAWRATLAIGLDGLRPLLWLTVYVMGSVVMTLYWTVAGATFDAREAKRLFPLLTASAIGGSFVGTLAAGPVAAITSAEDLVLIEALALLAALPLVRRLAQQPRVATGRPARDQPSSRTRGSMVGDLRAGFDVVRGSPVLRGMALAYVLLSVLMFSVSYPFMISASQAFSTDAELATALGLLSAGVTATSFLVSVLVANRVYARFGVSAGALVLPVVYLVGFGVWLVRFSFATAAAFRFTQQVTQRGLSNASWSAFYNVVPTERRAQVLAFNDGVPGQLGTILSGVLLLAAGRILAPDQVFWLGAIAAALATAVVIGVRRGYGASLVAALRSAPAERILEGGPGIAVLVRDPSVGGALIEATRAPEPGVREMAAEMLGHGGVADARAALREVARDEDARVRAAAIRALAGLPGGLTDDDVDPLALAADPDPHVRAAAIVGRAASMGDEALPLVSDPAEPVRVAAVAALGAAPLGPAARAAAMGALDDPSSRVRNAAAVVLGRDEGPPEDLVGTAVHGSARASLAALDALAQRAERVGQEPEVREPVQALALAQVERAVELRRDRLSLAASHPGDMTERDRAAQAFLVDVIGSRERDLVGRALAALAVLGAPEAPGLIRRCLAADDPQVRAQAIEALESLGDRRLAGVVVRLLEGHEPGGALDRRDVLARLAHDEDPWLRRLAQACQGGPAVAEATRSLSDLDTMLALRRVPLFEGLDPEDLQRIAATAIERTYAPDEALMHEGGLDDELVVLLDGTVRVVRSEPDGSTRLIRTYEAGDHIGELAVLRDGPRVATVLAEPGGARGLVVAGSALKSILHERPDAAMAMLATLAERISRQ